MICALALVFVVSIAAFGQERKALEEKRQQLLKDIKITSNLLGDTRQNKAATLDRYVTLQKQIKKRQQLVKTLQTEIVNADRSIARSTEVVDALGADIEQLREEYAGLIRAAYRQQLTSSSLLFLFSSGSVNEAYRRWQYLRRYDEFRRRHATLILETQKTLQEKIELLEKRRKEKETLIASEQEQSKKLQEELNTKNRLLADLKADESRLTSELRAQQRSHEKLDRAIEKIIRSAVAKSDTNEQVIAGIPSEATPERKVDMGLDFGNKKGQLRWPVQNGVVTRYFGTQPHPTLPNIQISNNGIDIRTDQNAEVRAVYPGRIEAVQFVPGYNYMVIIKHGDYYTVYSNLETVAVQRGDQLAQRSIIGRASVDGQTNISSVHFEVWQQREKLNPIGWLTR